MLSMGPVLRFRLKGREWNLLSLDNEAEGGALEGGEDWLKSGGVSVSDLAGSSPTAENKKAKVNIHFEGKNPSCYVNCLFYCRDALRVFNE